VKPRETTTNRDGRPKQRDKTPAAEHGTPHICYFGTFANQLKHTYYCVIAFWLLRGCPETDVGKKIEFTPPPPLSVGLHQISRPLPLFATSDFSNPPPILYLKFLFKMQKIHGKSGKNL
jgi:hypothetical protein